MNVLSRYYFLYDFWFPPPEFFVCILGSHLACSGLFLALWSGVTLVSAWGSHKWCWRFEPCLWDARSILCTISPAHIFMLYFVLFSGFSPSRALRKHAWWGLEPQTCKAYAHDPPFSLSDPLFPFTQSLQRTHMRQLIPFPVICISPIRSRIRIWGRSSSTAVGH